MKKISKVAIVTGGTRGIGLGAAENLIRRGYCVVVCSRDQKEVEKGVKILENVSAKTNKELKGKNKGLKEKKLSAVFGLTCDVSKEKDWVEMVKAVVKKWGRIDVLVNNAGILLQRDLMSMKYEEAENVLNINLLGQWLGIKTIVPHMKKIGGGRVVNIASIAGLRGYAGLGAYCMSKFGVVGLTKVAAKELAPFGIRVNAVCPGLIDTDMTKDWMDNKTILKPLISEIPMARAGKSSEIGNVIGFLADEDSSFVTGSTYVADGGNLA